MFYRNKKFWLGCLLSITAAGCSDMPELGGLGSAAVTAKGGSTPLTVMSRNLYVGTEIDALLTAEPEQVPVLVAQKWQEIQATDFPARAKGLADEILRTKPDVIGLQEADEFRIQANGDFLGGVLTPNATDVALDFISVLIAELNKRGLSYGVAAKQQGLDVELPMITSTNPLRFADLRYTEYDAILVRSGVNTGATYQKNYAVNAPLVVAGVPLNWKRGWVGVEVIREADTVVVTSTHQEVQPFQPVGEYQAVELIQTLTQLGKPVIAVGDFNSAANADAPAQSKTAAYGRFIAAGFVDLWDAPRSGKPGLTCCHAADLRSNTRDFDQRLDLMFAFDPNRAFSSFSPITIVGDTERGANGMYASDHAGVVVTVYFNAHN